MEVGDWSEWLEWVGHQIIQEQVEKRRMKITMDGKWQTKSGLPVRILTVDRKSKYSVVGLVGDPEDLVTFTAEGEAPLSEDHLIPVPQEWTITVPIYQHSNGLYTYYSEKDGATSAFIGYRSLTFKI